jgi:hypothetical protein
MISFYSLLSFSHTVGLEHLLTHHARDATRHPYDGSSTFAPSLRAMYTHMLGTSGSTEVMSGLAKRKGERPCFCNPAATGAA